MNDVKNLNGANRLLQYYKLEVVIIKKSFKSVKLRLSSEGYSRLETIFEQVKKFNEERIVIINDALEYCTEHGLDTSEMKDFSKQLTQGNIIHTDFTHGADLDDKLKGLYVVDSAELVDKFEYNPSKDLRKSLQTLPWKVTLLGYDENLQIPTGEMIDAYQILNEDTKRKMPFLGSALVLRKINEKQIEEYENIEIL